jgi:hypothetical protein
MLENGQGFGRVDDMQMSVRRSQMYSPDLPWTTNNVDDLGRNVTMLVRDLEPFYRQWFDVWYENFQFLLGNHQIKWSRRYGFAVDYDFLRREQSPFFLRSQTNIARPVAEALAALLYANLPTWEVDAMTESSVKGKRFKTIIQKALDCYMVRNQMDKEFGLGAMLMTMFGQFAWKVNWNYSAGKIMEIPMIRQVQQQAMTSYMAPNPITGGLMEVPTPVIGADGRPVVQSRWEPILDNSGNVRINKFFAGDVNVSTLTPFEYRRAPGSHGMHKTRWVQHLRLMDYDEYLDEYGAMPGKTKKFERIRPITSDPMVYQLAVRHFMRMQFSTPPSVDNFAWRADATVRSNMLKSKVLVIEHYDKPHPTKWPLGRKVVCVNGECTHRTVPEYHTGKLDGWHPFVEAQWMTVAPSSIGIGPMNDVIKKNREVDIIDSLQATAVRRNMGSTLLLRNGMGLDPQQLTGMPGAAHVVNDIMGARWLHDDMPIPPAMPQIRQQHKDDIYEVSGAGEALRGQPSTGATSGYQEKQREEREEKRLTPPRKNFESAVSSVGEKIWACLKQNVVRLDDDVIGFLKRSAAGEYTMQDCVAVLTSNVDFGVEIKVEKTSMAVKSHATHQATLIELASGPAATRIQQDAKVLDKFLEEFDAETLRDASAPHRDRAQRENEMFLDMLRVGLTAEGVQMPYPIFADDDVIHDGEHSEFEIRHYDELITNPTVYHRFLEHKEWHRIQNQEKGGAAAPGTAMLTPQMYPMAQQQPTPTPQSAGQSAMMMQQQKAQQPPQGGGAQPPNAQATSGQTQAPQAPRPRSAASGGGRTTDPSTPSQATPQARTGGGMGR